MLVPPPMRSMSSPSRNAPTMTTTPTHGRHRSAAHRARHGGLARADALEHELRAATQEVLGGRPLADDLGRRPARPVAVGVGPEQAIAVTRLDGARRGHVEGG